MRGFFGELRRRGVAKAAAVYAVVAWAVIESSSVIFPALQLPEWTVTFVVLLALIGFPVTLIFSWTFDWTREGIVRTPGRDDLPVEEVQSLRRGRVIDFAVIAVLVVVIGWLGWERVFDREKPVVASALDSIAVLPFVNMSGDPANEYFGDGLAEELLNALVRVEGLRVAARTSSFEYKGQNIDIRRIGDALNVATVLEGSVRQAGSRIRVTAQLIRADDGFHLWSETYDADREDIFAVQDRITLSIVDALRVRLAAHDRARMTSHGTRDVEAFEAYLRGRYEMHRRTAASLQRAIADFRVAIARDPDYAAAYSGLSDSWLLAVSYGGIELEEGLRQAEPMARRALALDPQLAEAHASMGLLLRSQDRTADSVEPLRRAIELNPSYTVAYHWLALSLQQLGRIGEAVDMLQKTVELDPHYVTGKRVLVGYLRSMGRHAEADALAERIARDHANDPMAMYGLAADAQALGRHLDALRFAARGLAFAPDNQSLRISTAYLLLNMGDVDRADAQIEIMRRLNPGHPIVAGWAADRAMMAGDVDTARAVIRQRYAELSPGPQRDGYGCNALQLAGDIDEAARACTRILERAGWRRGGPLPPGQVNAAANLLLVASERGEHGLHTELLQGISDEFDRFADEGLDRTEVDWARAVIAAHAHGELEAMLEMLPGHVARGSWNWRLMRVNPIFMPIRDDPRFEAVVERLREREARDLETARAIDIPGL